MFIMQMRNLTNDLLKRFILISNNRFLGILAEIKYVNVL